MMNIGYIIRIILNQLSAGNALQNVGFYTLMILLIWIVSVQFRYKAESYLPAK